MRPTRAPLLYRGLTTLAAAPALLYTAFRAGRDGKMRYLRQRYAFGLPKNLQGRIGLHCCSVGEVRAALPLVRQLQEEGESLFLSVSTPTGRRMARTLLPETPCVYFPLDHGLVVRRWLRVLQPRAMLIMETELWPTFFAAADTAGIALASINARLSSRTETAPTALRPALVETAQRLRCILARSSDEARRFAALGVPEGRIQTLGNIKYATAAAPVSETPPILRPYVLAVSTHDNEEQQLAETWATLEAHGHVLVLLPRYPHRATRLLKDLHHWGLNLRLHSRDLQPDSQTQLYLVDTLGEALWWIRHAAFVFVGGSLIRRGGHNVLEPAMLGKACVVGPHMEHFQTETAALLQDGGLLQVRDRLELKQIFTQWLAQPEQAEQVGARALAHMRHHHQVAQRYVDALRHYLVLSS